MADKKLSAPAKCAAAVLLLQFHNTRTGQCNPSYASIAKGMGGPKSGAGASIRAWCAACCASSGRVRKASRQIGLKEVDALGEPLWRVALRRATS